MYDFYYKNNLPRTLKRSSSFILFVIIKEQCDQTHTKNYADTKYFKINNET